MGDVRMNAQLMPDVWTRQVDKQLAETSAEMEGGGRRHRPTASFDRAKSNVYDHEGIAPDDDRPLSSDETVVDPDEALRERAIHGSGSGPADWKPNAGTGAAKHEPNRSSATSSSTLYTDSDSADLYSQLHDGARDSAANSDAEDDLANDTAGPRDTTAAVFAQERVDPFKSLWCLPMPYFVLAMGVLSIYLYQDRWPVRYFKSGAPFLSFALLLGKPGALLGSPLALTLSIGAITVAYLACETSWLFYYVYMAICWPTTLITSLVRSSRLQRRTRQLLRVLLGKLYLFGDRVAVFDIPAIEVDDGDVPVVLAIRGVTWTLSTMTFRVHAVEVGVQLNDDVTLAFQTDKFIWRVGRNIEVGDVYVTAHGPFSDHKLHRDTSQDIDRAEDKLAQTKSPREISKAGKMGMTMQSAGSDDAGAEEAYRTRVKQIYDTHEAHRARKSLDAVGRDKRSRRALTSAYLFNQDIVPNLPDKMVKSSVLKAMVPRIFYTIMESCPFLFRLFLNPMAYLHPIRFSGVIAGVNGRYLDSLVDAEYFDKYAAYDSKELRKLKNGVRSFLKDGHFTVLLEDLHGLASVPFLTQYPIITYLKAPKITVLKVDKNAEGKPVRVYDGGEIAMTHARKPSVADSTKSKSKTKSRKSSTARSNNDDSDATKRDGDDQATADGKTGDDEAESEHEDEEEHKDVQVVARIGGVALTCEAPEHLLPLHEHLLPRPPRDAHEPDCSHVHLSFLVSLPARLSGRMAEFAMSMLKISQILTVAQRANSLSQPVSTVGEFTTALGKATKEQATKKLVEAHVDDGWLRRIVDKAFGALATAEGDLGYSFKVPVDRAPLRQAGSKRYVSRAT